MSLWNLKFVEMENEKGAVVLVGEWVSPHIQNHQLLVLQLRETVIRRDLIVANVYN